MFVAVMHVAQLTVLQQVGSSALFSYNHFVINVYQANVFTTCTG